MAQKPTARFIQVAGARSPDEAMMIAACGATHLGLPLRLDVHAEELTDAQAKKIAELLPAGCVPVLITYLNRAPEILSLSAKLSISWIQLHGHVDIPQLQSLQSARAKGLVLIKSLIIRPENGFLDSEIRKSAPYVDFFITDTFDPATGAGGATGKTHDWEISRRAVEKSPRPVILAGGLHPGNVKQAVELVGPWGVDAHTGLENENGWKEKRLVKKFVERAERALKKDLPKKVKSRARD
jgi:phosphoribosylanthranilate isomerase